MPYLASWNHLVPISYYRGKNGVQFLGVFDPKVESRLEAGVKAYCRINAKTSNNVIGYCWTDLGSWPLENPAGKNWVDFIRNLPPDAPGQKAYQSFIERWDGEGGKARDQAFLRLIAREYFRIIGEAQRKHAPHHLVFGDRFAFNTVDPEVVKEMLPYVDGIAIQPPFHGQFPKEKFDEIHKLTQKPVLICDFAIRFKRWRKGHPQLETGRRFRGRGQSLCCVCSRRPTNRLRGRRLLVQPRRHPQRLWQARPKTRVLRKRSCWAGRAPSVGEGSQLPPRGPYAKELRLPLPSLLSEKS